MSANNSEHSTDTPDDAKEPGKRIDISTADDVNVDDDNDVGSPKESLSAEVPDSDHDDEEPADENRRGSDG